MEESSLLHLQDGLKYPLAMTQVDVSERMDIFLTSEALRKSADMVVSAGMSCPSHLCHANRASLGNSVLQKHIRNLLIKQILNFLVVQMVAG